MRHTCCASYIYTRIDMLVLHSLTSNHCYVLGICRCLLSRFLETLIFLQLQFVERELYTNVFVHRTSGKLSQTSTYLRPDTQKALEEGKDLFPELKANLNTVKESITGDTLNKVHANFKDLVCCTYHGAINSVYAAWMAAAIAGLILAILVSIQVIHISRAHYISRGQEYCLDSNSNH